MSDTVFPPNAPCDLDIRRRFVGVAQHLNIRASFDLGVSRVSPPAFFHCLQHQSLVAFLPVSASLDPRKAEDDGGLELSLSTNLRGNHSQPPSVSTQCNLVLAILGRVGAPSFNIPPALIEQILTLLKHGLKSARILIKDCCPWHHLHPSRTDTRASLAILPDAMQTLELVASVYDTDTMRLTCGTAYPLVMLYQNRRTKT